MITANGYSKDPSIMPEGIAITFGKGHMKKAGGTHKFLARLESTIEEYIWIYTLSALPKHNVIHVYFICCGRLYARANYLGHGDKPGTIEFIGPLEKPGRKIYMKGFQGFRYTTKLF